MVKVTIWTSGLYYVGVLYGSVMSRYVSSTRPQKRCCRWPASSTAGPFTASGKYTPWPAAASTATGKPWRAFSWNPVKRDPESLTVQHTPSSDCFHSSKQPVWQHSALFMCCLYFCDKNPMQEHLKMWQITFIWLHSDMKSAETAYFSVSQIQINWSFF